MVSVLQPWLENIPIRMQSTLLLGLRGPDNGYGKGVKSLTRWLRGLAFKPGNPRNCEEFMTQAPMEVVDRGEIHRELEYYTIHYVSHLLHALEVVAFCHPDSKTAKIAEDRYRSICYIFHLNPESKNQFDMRLGTIDWPEGQPNDFQEALAQLERQHENPSL